MREDSTPRAAQSRRTPLPLAVRLAHAVFGGTVPAGPGVAPGHGGGPPRDGAGGLGPPGDHAARRPKLAAECPDAGAAEPQPCPRAPALQARGPCLDAALALARGADAVPGPSGAGPGGARPRGDADGRPDPPGAGQRALRAVGDLHRGRGLAWAGATGRLGGAALPVAQGPVHAAGVRPAAPGGRRLAGRAAGAPGGRPGVPQPPTLPDAPAGAVGLDGAPARQPPG